jgi:hypothetical protein
MHTDTLAYNGQACLNKYVNCLDGKGREAAAACAKRDGQKIKYFIHFFNSETL